MKSGDRCPDRAVSLGAGGGLEGGGRFDLRVRLPVEVDAGQVKAIYRNGLLEVRMPMVEVVPLRPVRIHVER